MLGKGVGMRSGSGSRSTLATISRVSPIMCGDPPRARRERGSGHLKARSDVTAIVSPCWQGDISASVPSTITLVPASGSSSTAASV